MKKKAPAKSTSGRSKKKKATKRLVAETPPVKSQPTFETKFTKTELIHLRDLLGVFLPPDGEMTVSQSLARQEGRVIAEKLLFDKIVELCVKAKVPVGEAAPDHIVGLVENPTLGVFQMSPEDEETDEAVIELVGGLAGLTNESTVFSDDDEDDGP